MSITYKCIIEQVQDGKWLSLAVAVSSGGSWKVLSGKWDPQQGNWDASDIRGQGGCVCYGADDRKILKLNEFKPYGREIYKVGKVGNGKGKFISPLMPTLGTDFDWTIETIEN